MIVRGVGLAVKLLSSSFPNQGLFNRRYPSYLVNTRDNAAPRSVRLDYLRKKGDKTNRATTANAAAALALAAAQADFLLVLLKDRRPIFVITKSALPYNDGIILHPSLRDHVFDAGLTLPPKGTCVMQVV